MEMTRRAYSCIEVKAVNEERRIIRGVATSPAVDRVGDIVDPMGVKFQNPLPLLWQHKHDKPIGTVKFDAPTEKGINFEAELPVVSEAGTLRDRIEEAWQSIKRLGARRVHRLSAHRIQFHGGRRHSLHRKRSVRAFSRDHPGQRTGRDLQRWQEP